MSAVEILFALGVCAILLGLCLADRRPAKDTPCDCTACEAVRPRPRSLPLKPERDRLAKDGHHD